MSGSNEIRVLDTCVVYGITGRREAGDESPRDVSAPVVIKESCFGILEYSLCQASLPMRAPSVLLTTYMRNSTAQGQTRFQYEHQVALTP